MSIIHRDYLPDRKPEPIPLELAARIARAAAAEADSVERQTVAQASREALATLPPDTDPALIARLIAQRAVALADRAKGRAVERLVTAARRSGIRRSGRPAGTVPPCNGAVTITTQQGQHHPETGWSHACAKPQSATGLTRRWLTRD